MGGYNFRNQQHFKPTQVGSRWETIFSSYRKAKDAKKESGGARKDYEFESLFDDIRIDIHTTVTAFIFSLGKLNEQGVDTTYMYTGKKENEESAEELE